MTVGFLDKFFNKKKQKDPEDYFAVTITDVLIRVEHPNRPTEQVLWQNIQKIKFINTIEGPWMPDVWLVLMRKEDGCLIPQGAKGFDEVYEIVSKYEGFNFENAINSMKCTDNKEFHLWSRRNKN